MLTAIFAVLMLLVFGELLWASVKLAWSVWKIVFSFVFFPIAMVLMAVSGLIAAAIPILAIVGIVALILALTKQEKAARKFLAVFLLSKAVFFMQKKCCKKNIKFLAKKTYLFYFFLHIKFVRIWFLCFWWLYEKGQYRKRYVWSLRPEQQTSAMQPEKKKKYLKKYLQKVLHF